jgi:hypothetical protein
MIQRVMALDLPIAVGAKAAGLSQTGYYRRIQKLGWTASEVRARRSLISRYLFGLRAWLRQQSSLSSLDQILQRHSAALRSEEAERFRPFTPYIPHLEAELLEKPATVGEVRSKRDSSAVVTLAAKIFQRARGIGKVASSRKVGAKPVKKNLFLEAAALYLRLNSWGKVAQKLLPRDYAKDKRGTADRLRLGAKYHEQSTDQS